MRVLTLSASSRSYRDGTDYYIKSHSMPVYPETRLSAVRHDPLIDELIEWVPDIIHMHTEFSTARLARVIATAHHTPHVMTVHSNYAQFLFGSHFGLWPIQKTQEIWSIRAFRGTRAIIAPSQKAAELAATYRTSCPIVVIPNGIDLTRFQRDLNEDERAALLSSLGLANNHQVAVSISRVSHEKRTHDLVDYMPALLEREPDAQLLIVGDGPTRKKLIARAAELGVSEHVRFSGPIPMEDVWRYYRLGDLYVSSSNFEMHSIAYLEAVASGLPLVCRDDFSLKGVLQDGDNGFIFTDETSYVSSVSQLLRDTELRDRMAARSLAISQQYSERANAERTLELYENVLNGTL